MNITEFLEDTKFCPKCSGLLAVRMYIDAYEDYDIDPKTGKINEESFDDGKIGESGWMVYCKGSGCGWEFSDADEYDEDVQYCENDMCGMQLEEGRSGFCDNCLNAGHGD